MVQRRLGLFHVFHHRRLGDLEHDGRRRHAGRFEHGFDALHVVHVHQLARRHVDADRRRQPHFLEPACLHAGVLEHPLPDLQDLAGLLGDVDELARAEQRSIGCTHAHERFGEHRLLRLRVDDGLEVQHQSVLLKRQRQRLLDIEVLAHRIAVRRVVDDREVAALPLGRVHRAVGARDQLVGRELGVVAQHDADRGLRVQQRTVARIRLAHRIDDARRDRARAAFGGDAVEQRDKLVAAHSRQRIAGPQDRAHAVRGLDQVVVAGAVAERIVDLLEAVEVEQKQHERPLLARGAELRQRGRERGTVRQAGQVVGLGGARELVAQLVARLDITCHRDRLGDAAVQAVGMAQRHLEADVAAVLVAPVAFEQHRPARAGSVLQRVDPVVGLARMQQLENSDSLHFVRRIAEVRQNRRRHVLDEPLGVDLHHDVFGVQLHEAVALDALGQRHLAPLHLEEDLVVAVDHRLQHDGQALADAVGQGQAEFGEVAERRLERTLFAVAPLQFAVGHDRGGGRQRDRRRQKAGRDHSQREVDDAAGDRDDGEREQLAHREP